MERQEASRKERGCSSYHQLNSGGFGPQEAEMHTFEIYHEPADTDEPRKLLGTIQADTMAEALHKASQYWEIPSHDLDSYQITKNTLFRG